MSGHIAIDVPDSVVDSIRKRLFMPTSSRASNEQPTIYRVPERIRQHENKAYEPRLVSIGPYHHNKQSLVPMEEHKWRYLQAILSRNPAVSLEDYLAKIKALEAQARRSYSESIELDSNEFLEMMLLDGCFIVELFAKRLENDGDDDPLYGNEPLLRFVGADMLLLENQLPYCILQCIFSCVFPDEQVDVKLVEEAIGFCDRLVDVKLVEGAIGFCDHLSSLLPHPRQVGPYLHLLHLLHYHCLPSTLRLPIEMRLRLLVNEFPNESLINLRHRTINLLRHRTINLRHRTVPSAEKLVELGIKFKRKAGEDSVLDVEFKKNGVMEIPYLIIDDITICLFRNFMAFEQCYPSAGSHFTVYTVFMGTIINTKADVEILRNKRILEHACGSNEELARLFCGLTKGTPVDIRDSYLSSLFNNVNAYCDSKLNRCRACLMCYYMCCYLTKPWVTLVLRGTAVVLILTAIQTFFSVFAYVRPPQ